MQLRLQQPRHILHDFVQLYSLKLRLRHSGKFAEARMIVFRFAISASSVEEPSRKDFIELFRTLLPRPHQVFHRELQREQRILQLVRQAARQFAPRGNPLRLHQLFPLLQKFCVMRLNDSASAPSSSAEFTGTWCSSFPPPLPAPRQPAAPPAGSPVKPPIR